MEDIGVLCILCDYGGTVLWYGAVCLAILSGHPGWFCYKDTVKHIDIRALWLALLWGYYSCLCYEDLIFLFIVMGTLWLLSYEAVLDLLWRHYGQALALL